MTVVAEQQWRQLYTRVPRHCTCLAWNGPIDQHTAIVAGGGEEVAGEDGAAGSSGSGSGWRLDAVHVVTEAEASSGKKQPRTLRVDTSVKLLRTSCYS